MRVRANLRSLTLAEIGAWVEERGLDGYRAAQLAGWLYNRPPTPVAGMQNLPAEFRQALERDFDTSIPELEIRSDSSDGTTKLVLRLADGELIESVVIPREDRLALCISSQVGCALGCTFCATARLGFRRNLEPFEIVAQVQAAREIAAPHPLSIRSKSKT